MKVAPGSALACLVCAGFRLNAMSSWRLVIVPAALATPGARTPSCPAPGLALCLLGLCRLAVAFTGCNLHGGACTSLLTHRSVHFACACHRCPAHASNSQGLRHLSCPHEFGSSWRLGRACQLCVLSVGARRPGSWQGRVPAPRSRMSRCRFLAGRCVISDHS